MQPDDRYLIQKCLDGDSAAFSILVDKYKAGVYALAYSMLRNFHDAEDVAQEAFIKAYQKLRTLKYWDDFPAWLYSITSNLCKNWIRAKAKRPDREYISDQDPSVTNRPPTEARSEAPIYELLHESLNSLPEIYRQALMLYYLGDMSTREIARFLGTSSNNIAQRLKRARVKLKGEMLAMMSTNFEEKKLSVGFTFRIAEAIKRIKIQPMPRATGLPWGISVAAAIIIAVLSIGSRLTLPDLVDTSMDSGLPSLTTTMEAGEMPVDVLKFSRISNIGNGRGNDYRGGTRPPEQQNAFLPAPGAEEDGFPEKPQSQFGKGSINEIRYSPDGQLLAVAGGLGIWLYDANNLDEIGFLEGEWGASSVAFSPDGKLLVSGIGNKVCIWDVQEQGQIGALESDIWDVTCVALSPDGKLIALANWVVTPP